MQLSRFFKSMEITDNVYAVFNTLLMNVLFVNKQELNDIINLKHKEIDLLKKSGIYIDNSSNDDNALLFLQNNYKNQAKKVNVLYFILSTGCNLRCKYCFVENNKFNNHNEINMSEEIALEAVNKYINYLKNNDIYEPQIIFYGGEPFVNFSVMEKIVQSVKQSGLDIGLSLVTNGTLLDDNKISFLKKNDFKIGISIDGPKKINDENRIYREPGLSVYDTVIETVDKLEEAQVPYCFSITVSKALIKNKDEYFKWIKSLKTKEIFYNLYHYGCLDDSSDWPDFYKEMSLFLIESYETLNTHNIKEGRLARKIDSITTNTFKFADCASIGANQLTIKPNGDVSICHGYCKTDKNIVGNIKNNTISELINNPNSETWVNLSPICRNECLDCEALYLCGGGCAVQAETLFGNVNEIDKCFCVHSKESLKWLLNKMYLFSKNEEV